MGVSVCAWTEPKEAIKQPLTRDAVRPCPELEDPVRASRSSRERQGAGDRLNLARRLLERYESRRGRWRDGPRCATGLAALDEALGGGMPLGTVCEMISSGEGAGAVELALRVARAATGGTRMIFLIDPQGDFYPPATERLGIALPRLILVHRLRRTDAVWAMEQALRCGAVGAVVGLFGVSEARSARRLQLAAEAGGRVGLLVHGDTEGTPAAFAGLRMVVEATKKKRNRASRRAGTSDGSPKDRASVGSERDGARCVRVRLLKARMGTSIESFLVEFGSAEGDVRVHAVSGDGPARVRCSATG